jgi:hypothetical protein
MTLYGWCGWLTLTLVAYVEIYVYVLNLSHCFYSVNLRVDSCIKQLK